MTPLEMGIISAFLVYRGPMLCRLFDEYVLGMKKHA